MTRLDQITELAKAFFAAREAHRAHFRTKPEKFDLDNEDHIRWQIRYDRLISAHVKSEAPYRDASDAFFKTTAPDLIQLLTDLDEHFEGEVDINSNGGPNMAMRCVQMIEELIGPTPVAEIDRRAVKARDARESTLAPLPVYGIEADCSRIVWKSPRWRAGDGREQMAKATFTSGPWRLIGGGIRQNGPSAVHYQQIGTKEWGVGEVQWDSSRPEDRETQIANACLMSAAPEMYAALAGILEDDDATTSLEIQRKRWNARMDAARAALAKARGE